MNISISKVYNDTLGVVEINEIVNALSDQFGAFYSPFLYKMHNELIDYLKDKEKTVIKNADYFMKNILYDVIPELVELCSRVLITEFWNYKSNFPQRVSKGSDMYLEYYSKLEDGQIINGILDKYVVLKDIINNFLKQRIFYIKECINNYEKDKEEIYQIFNIHSNKLIKVNITSGDTHHKGRKVIMVTLEDGTLIYKPRSLEAEHTFYELLDIISDNNISKAVRLKDISHNTYSWQELAVYKTAESLTDVKKYYFYLGEILFTADLCCSHDLHHENIIACKDTPILIDMETLVDSGPQPPEIGDQPLKYINYECINSVLGTILLPTNCIHMVFDFDISAISGRNQYESNSWYDFIMINKGTDNICLEKVYKLGVYEEEKNLLKYNNQIVNPRNYLCHILEGYQNAYNVFSLKKGEIKNIISNNKLRIRQVLRPTAIYGKFLMASLYSDYLVNWNKYKSLFRRLINNKAIEKSKLEIIDLLNRDVPYFYSELDEKNLYSYQGKVNNYFPCSSKDVVLNKMDLINKNYIDKQMYYIKLAMSTLDNTNGNEEVENLFKQQDDILDMAIKIADKMEKKQFWNKESTDCYMLTTSVIKGKRKICMLNYNLYDGGGVLLFYIGLYITTQEKKYKNIINGFFNACITTKAIKGNFDELGVFNGKMSYIYIYYILYKYINIEKCKNLIEIIRDEMYRDLDSFVLEDDIIAGLSGMLILSINIIEDNKIDGFQKLVTKISSILAQRYSSSLKSGTNVKTGLAHGLSGVGWALYKAGNYENNGEYINLALDCIRLENSYFDEELGNWKDMRDGKADLSYWCYGAPGILAARLKMQQIRYDEEIETDIKRGISAVNTIPGDSQCLCHGQLGNLNIISLLRNYYPNNSELETNYNVSKENILNELRNVGFSYGSKELIEDYSFMQGLTGVGYELLRMLNPELPNILVLEI